MKYNNKEFEEKMMTKYPVYDFLTSWLFLILYSILILIICIAFNITTLYAICILYAICTLIIIKFVYNIYRDLDTKLKYINEQITKCNGNVDFMITETRCELSYVENLIKGKDDDKRAKF